MPVIIPPDAYATWLDPKADRARLLPLLVPFTDQPLEAVAVGPAVNNARTEGPVCIVPAP
jgi:putative SOS response-associated peptidase YedK